ncbi:hypothetical protein [Paenibacillus sp. IITD108]
MTNHVGVDYCRNQPVAFIMLKSASYSAKDKRLRHPLDWRVYR